MNDWTKVKWTEARQIATALDEDEDRRPGEGVDPRSHYVALREAGEVNRALAYIGLALPRYEAVAWAASVLQSRAGKSKLPAKDRQALDRSLRWLEEPIDEYRRAAYEAAESAGRESPERFLGLAVYMSGGSVAPPDLNAVNPPQEVCGRLASTAVLIAAHRSDDPAKFLAAALDSGDRVAAEGVQALSGR